MGTIVGAGVRYMAIVIGAGVMFGIVRVAAVVPRLGERWAELAEMPFMAVVIVFAAGDMLRRFPRVDTPMRALAVGLLALALAIAAELLLAVVLQRRTLGAYIASRDPVSGSVYLAMLVVFALMPLIRLASIARRRATVVMAIVTAILVSGSGALAQTAATMAMPPRPVHIDAAPVPLNDRNPWQTRLGDFVYAGGLVLTSSETDQLHGLSDLVVTGANRLTAVADTGLLLEAHLQLDVAGRLTGIEDARLTTLVGVDGSRPRRKEDMDAEGLALLPNGDRLISFEVRDRVWLYPANGGLPRPVPSPAASFAPNTGLEALTAAPDVAADAYMVGDEEHGNIWNCRISTACVKGQPVELPPGYVLVSMRRLDTSRTAYLLRAFDLRRGNRNSLRIYTDGRLTGQLDLALPLTIDNFEGVAAVPRADGSVRFYLMSDDNARAFQRTLLMAFDWAPK
jgi:hypothetical protein